MRISDFFPSGGSANNFNLTAGADLSQSDLLSISSDGKGYPVKVTDYGYVSNVGQVIAQTSYGGGTYNGPSTRLPMFRDSSQNLYTVSTNSSLQGVKFFKYNAAGTLVGSLVIDSTAASLQNLRMFQLSNGNVGFVYVISNVIYFAVCDTALNLIVSPTSVETLLTWATYGYMDAIALSGGGFAISWQQDANPKLIRMAVYSNAGATVVAPTTMRTSSGTAGAWNQTTRLGQLTNGNIVLVIDDSATLSGGGSAADAGMYVGTFNPATLGAVVALARYNTVNAATTNPGEILITPSNFIVARYDGTNLKAWVFNNSAVLQGAAYSVADASNPVQDVRGIKLLWDGTQAWMIYGNATVKIAVKLPLTGTGYVATTLTGLTGIGNTLIDCALASDNVTVIMVSRPCSGYQDTSAPKYCIFKLDGTVITAPTNFAAGAASTNGWMHSVQWSTDFTFTCAFDNQSTSATLFYVGKYQAASIVGVATVAATAGTLVSAAQAIGTYPVNQLLGTIMKTFDHTTGATIYGNKGIMMPYGVVLKGM